MPHHGKGGAVSRPHHGSHRRHHWGRRWYIPTSRARLACGDGDAVPIQSRYNRETYHFGNFSSQARRLRPQWRLACGDGDAVPILSRYNREPHHVVGCSLAAPCSRTLLMPHHVVRYMSPLAAFLLTFRVEGNFSSPASPVRRGEAMSSGHRGKGAGWYARHQPQKKVLSLCVGSRTIRDGMAHSASSREEKKDKRLIITV